MRAIVFDCPGEPDVLAIAERPTLSPERFEVRVKVHGSGLNRADLIQRRGKYPAPPGSPKDILGLEYAGVVDAVGRDVFGVAVGDRVMGITGGGAYAEHVVVHAQETIRVPRELDLVSAAAIPEAFLTAYDALFTQGGLKTGETVLIHAVASGVGTAAMQLARLAGAHVIGSSRSQSKLDKAKAFGLERGVVTEGAWASTLADVDLVLDLVGGPLVAASLEVLRDRGRHVLVGLTAGMRADIDLGRVLGKRLALIGTVLRSRPLDEKLALTRQFERLMLEAFDRGQLRPVIDATIRPEDVAKAHARLERNDSFGKIVIDWTA